MRKTNVCFRPLGLRLLPILRIMKIICLFLLLFVGQLNAGTFAQNRLLDIDVKNASLRDVFEQIKQKSGISFMFSNDDVKQVGRKSIQMKNADVEAILNKCLEGTGLTYELMDNVAIIRKIKSFEKDSVKDLILKGVVKDETGSPLPGVTIRIKGTTIGVTTDQNGVYKLLLPKDTATVVFTFIGMQTVERKYTGQKEINVVLKERATEVDEVVVVTGYETIQKKRLTSAITSIKAEDIIVSGLSSIDQMLEGHIPDMMFMVNSGEVGVVPKIRIRGTSTLIGNREPLWVVDGVVMKDPVPVSPDELNDPDYVNRIGNAIAGLNPQDIENINVLKDASATALYGAKAANGVILITTKKGHKGKMLVSYNMTTTMKRRPRYSDNKINVMNSKERMDFSRDLFNSRYKYSNNMTEVGFEGLAKRLYDREIGYKQFKEGVDQLETENTDWFDLLTEDSFSHQHTLSLTGGTKDLRYYSSVGYARDNDVIKGNRNERYTVVLNMDANLTKYLAASFSIKGNVGERKYNQSSLAPMDYAYNTSRTIPAYAGDGSYFFYGKYNGVVPYKFNILNELEHSGYKQNNSNIMFDARLNFTFTNYLNAQVLFSYSTSNTEIEGYYDEQTNYVANLRKSEYGVEPVKATSELPFGGELNKDYTRNNDYTLRLQLNFNKYFGSEDQHNLNAVLGYEMNSSKYNGYTSTTRGYYPDRGKQFAQGTSLEEYSAYRSWLENNAYPVLTDNITNLLAGFLTVSYSYFTYFTLNANARIDGSNKFGDQSNDKLLPVWSVSGVYNISEHWQGESDIVNNLSLKLSYGYQGNMLEGQSPVMTINKKPTDPYYNELVSKVVNYPNPKLKWEKTSSFNAGLEFSLFRNRLMMSVDYYYKRTVDAFLSKPISSVNGLNQYVVNSGNVENQGYSIAVTLSPVKTSDFKWTLSTYFSDSFNKLKTKPGAEQYELSNFLNGTALVKGKSVGTFYSYKFIGLNPIDGGPVFDDMQEHSEDLKNLSKYDTYTQVLTASGSREPTMSGGITNTLKYKNMRLSCNLAYSLGAKVRLFKLYNNTTTWDPEKNVNREFSKRWRQPGDEAHTNIPAIINTTSAAYTYYNDHWSAKDGYEGQLIARNYWDMYNYGNQRVVSANYLKCTNLSFTYAIADHLLQKWGLSRLEVTLATTNLFTICSSELKGQTPTQSGFAEIQLSDRPTYSLGINVSF